MKIINIILLLCVSTYTFSNQAPAELTTFIPKNWEIISQAEGDLNADGQKDIAIIIQPKNTKILNRKLLILLKKDHDYQAVLSKNIPEWTYRDDENCIDDAFSSGGVSIKNAILDISYGSMSTCSNWYGETWTYRFKYIHSEFILTGFEYWFLYKTNGELKSYSGNFLTQKLKITLDNEFEENFKPQIAWKTLKPIQPNTLTKIKFQDSQNFLKQMIQ